MKNFGAGTILGLALGVFIGGYFVFAYAPPAQAPPDSNASAPLTTDSQDQTKQGDLWLNNGLIMGGGLRMGQSTVCNSAVKGTLNFNMADKKSFICDGSSWNEHRGLKGDTGFAGATGPQGPQGLQGPQGPPGI